MLEVIGVDGGDQSASREIRHCNGESVHGEGRTPARGAEELPRSHTHARVYRIHLHAFALEPREHRSIGWSSSDDFREDRGYGSDRKLTPAHLCDEGSNPIAPLSRSAGNRR